MNNDLARTNSLMSERVSPDSFPVTPNDGTDLASPVRALRAEVAGDIVANTASGNQRTMKFAAGETRYVAVTRVLATGTTATGIEGMP